MKVKEFDIFIADCLKGFCNRNTMYNNKTCKTPSKHESCYKKYLEQIERKQKKLKFKGFNSTPNYDIVDKDYRWEELKAYIKERDIICMAYKILTPDELSIVEKQEGWWLNNKFLDGAHIVPRSTLPAHIYNRDNVILLGRFLHSRIDNYLDLVTGEFIGQQGSADWWTRIMQSNKRWPNNYTYWDFKKDLENKI